MAVIHARLGPTGSDLRGLKSWRWWYKQGSLVLVVMDLVVKIRDGRNGSKVKDCWYIR